LKNILFDLDGTLTDSKPGIINSILFALKTLEIPENNINALDSFIGPPLRESFMIRYNLTANDGDRAINAYREYYSEKGLYDNRLYENITGLLASLNSRRYQLFVATSKPTVFAKKIIGHFSLDKQFREIVGSNLDNCRTDKTEIISHIISEHGLSTSDTIMIGDRKNDIIGAKNNRIKSIGVTYGYGTMEEISEHTPDYIARDCFELKSILST
jgi:phosphoglycolate phosphatase